MSDLQKLRNYTNDVTSRSRQKTIERKSYEESTMKPIQSEPDLGIVNLTKGNVVINQVSDSFANLMSRNNQVQVDERSKQIRDEEIVQAPLASKEFKAKHLKRSSLLKLGYR